MPNGKNSKRSGPDASRSVVASATAPKVSWPALPNPSQRSHPLELDEILASQILLIHGFLPAKACSTWLKYLQDSSNIPLSASPAAKRGEAQRTNHRFSIHDPAFAEALWSETGLKELLFQHASNPALSSSERVGAKPAGLNPNIRIYRYEPGQHFAPHYDDTVKVGLQHTEWTLLIYLSGPEDVKGGETAFYPSGVAPSEASKSRKKTIPPGQEDVVVELQRGLALLHRHGRECLLHEGRPVLSGTKWVLRSDLVMAI